MAPTTPLFWRFDFGGIPTAQEFVSFWYDLDPTLRARVDLVEDPICESSLDVEGPWANDWKQLPQAKIRVVKPVRDSTENLRDFNRVVFTHSMDHTLGQVSALWSAARFYADNPKKTEVGGFAQPAFYVPDEFSKAWPSEGPRLKPTPGFGFGFDEILESLTWERLF